LSINELNQIHIDAVKMAYKIIELKRATFYGIGTALAKIVRAVLNNENTINMIGAKLNGEYGQSGIYTGVPAIINENG
jgi:L-lactate dehydrogenase